MPPDSAALPARPKQAPTLKTLEIEADLPNSVSRSCSWAALHLLRRE